MVPRPTTGRENRMHDNAPSHAAKNSMSYLESIGIFGSRLMNWPPSSPDSNPIDNFWGIIKRNVYAENKQFHSKDDLWRAIVNVPNELTQTIKKLTSSVDLYIGTDSDSLYSHRYNYFMVIVFPEFWKKIVFCQKQMNLHKQKEQFVF